MIDYKELNNLTDLIDHIDLETTRICNKIFELEHLIEKYTVTVDEQFATSLRSKRKSLMREYDLLITQFGKLVEKRREILDPIINDLTKKEKKKKKTKFTYDDYLIMSKEKKGKDWITGKEWHDFKPEDRMLILEDWGFGDVIKEFKNNI